MMKNKLQLMLLNKHKFQCDKTLSLKECKCLKSLLIFTNNAPLPLTLIVRPLSALIYKTAFCGLILCDSKEYWRTFLSIISVSNDTKRKEIKKTTLGISEL